MCEAPSDAYVDSASVFRESSCCTSPSWSTSPGLPPRAAPARTRCTWTRPTATQGMRSKESVPRGGDKQLATEIVPHVVLVVIVAQLRDGCDNCRCRLNNDIFLATRIVYYVCTVSFQVRRSDCNTAPITWPCRPGDAPNRRIESLGPVGDRLRRTGGGPSGVS